MLNLKRWNSHLMASPLVIFTNIKNLTQIMNCYLKGVYKNFHFFYLYFKIDRQSVCNVKEKIGY
jgi:hypothetical protein